jgi:hypothetical protein
VGRQNASPSGVGTRPVNDGAGRNPPCKLRYSGRIWKRVVNDLEGIGFLQPAAQKGVETYRIPFLYREGLQLTQGLET